MGERVQEHRPNEKRQAQLAQARPPLRQAPTEQVAERQRQHENRDDAAPDINAGPKPRRQRPPAKQFERHDDEAADEGEEVDGDGIGQRHWGIVRGW